MLKALSLLVSDAACPERHHDTDHQTAGKCFESRADGGTEYIVKLFAI